MCILQPGRFPVVVQSYRRGGQLRMSCSSKRRWGFVLLAFVVIVLIASTLDTGDHVTASNRRKIKAGMTEKEVEEILGPEGDHTGWPHAWNGPAGGWREDTRLPTVSELVTFKHWAGEQGWIIVVFYDGTVATSCFASTADRGFDNRLTRLWTFFREKLAQAIP
jgi:hypothetical protein